MAKVIDLRGQRFGILEVLDAPPIIQHRAAFWHCRCDCGKEILARGASMRKGERKSCGCQGRGPKKGQYQKSTAKLLECQYQLNVECLDRNCENCGWNPEVAKARNEKILENLNRRDL